MQSLLVVLIVAGCSAYALWVLMPAALRRRVAAALMCLPLPDALASRLRAAVAAAPGCGSCGSCAHDTSARPRGGEQAITVHRRIRR